MPLHKWLGGPRSILMWRLKRALPSLVWEVIQRIVCLSVCRFVREPVSVEFLCHVLCECMLHTFSFAYFPKVGLNDLHPVCVCAYHFLINFECFNYSLWNLACISWQLSPSQRRTSWNPPISRCVRLCILPTIERQRLGEVHPYFRC
jgi:hypothetical protein